MGIMTIEGTVLSGKGQGASYVGLPWVQRQIREIFKVSPYPGTLNLKLSEGDFSSLVKALKEIQAVKIVPERGYCQARCFEARLRSETACIVIIPRVRNYPRNMIELIAEHNLKEKCKIKDGDIVEFEIE